MAEINDKTSLCNIELTKLLIKKNKLKKGYYELSVGFVFTAGGVHGPEGAVLPGMTIGINGVSLSESTPDNKNAVNAAEVK